MASEKLTELRLLSLNASAYLATEMGATHTRVPAADLQALLEHHAGYAEQITALKVRIADQAERIAALERENTEALLEYTRKLAEGTEQLNALTERFMALGKEPPP